MAMDSYSFLQPWYTLSAECRLYLLEFVGEPTRTACIDKACNRLSQLVYKSLCERYECYPNLKKFLINGSLPPIDQVRLVFRGVFPSVSVREKIVLQCWDLFSPVFLDTMPEWSALPEEKKVDALELFCLAVDKATNDGEVSAGLLGLVSVAFHALKLNQLETWLTTHKDRLHNVQRLDLSNTKLKHLPPHILHFSKTLTWLSLSRCTYLLELPPWIEQCSALMVLSIGSTRLHPKNIVDVCESLPQLQRVTIDLFQEEFLANALMRECPHLTLAEDDSPVV